MPYRKLFALVVLGASLAAYWACESKRENHAENSADQRAAAPTPEPTKIIWAKDWNAAKSQAAAGGKLIMIDFYTDWCHWCKVLDEKTFPDARVIKLAAHMVPVKINAQKEGAQLARTYGVRGYPATFFVNASGQVIGTISGFMPPEEFAPQMQKFLDAFAKSPDGK